MSGCQLSDRIGYHTKNLLSIDNWVIWQTLVLSQVGLQGDRPLNTLLVVNVHLAPYGYLQ